MNQDPRQQGIKGRPVAPRNNRGSLPLTMIDSNEDAIRVLKLSGPVAVLFMLGFLLLADRDAEPGQSLLTTFHWTALGVTAAFFGITWLPAFRRRWRLWTLLFSVVIVSLFIRISVTTGDTVTPFLAILLCPVASASFVRWNPRWQAAMCVTCVLEFAAASHFLPLQDPFQVYRWLGLGAALCLAQFTAVFLHDYDRRLHGQFDLLTEAANFRERQVAMLAHDVRNPLSSVTGFVGIMEEDRELGEAERREMLTRIGLATRMMDLIVGNVLDYTNIEEGRLTPTRRIVDPNVITVEVASESLKRAQRKRVRFHTELNRMPSVNCDPHHLERILKNLMLNAIERAEHGQVLVTSESREGWVRIAITDSGPQLDRPALEALMAAPPPSTVRAWPTVVGMFVARSLVEANGGRMSVHSDDHAGLTVTVELPIESPP
ncbi:MAG TPA: HAMP domain-containing sensor histidine kinase [Candidatus Binataceae bacterium]|nr:HAMP domain-containing sensor histidine kinase [Candidatus Binataceae bacterium]